MSQAIVLHEDKVYYPNASEGKKSLTACVSGFYCIVSCVSAEFLVISVT